jgi:hypothetical protein
MGPGWLRRGRHRPDFEALERRRPLAVALALAPTAATPVVMESATTADSRSVTIVYDVVTPPGPADPLSFQIDRSALARFDASAQPVGGETIVAPGPGDGTPTLDLDGQPAASPGQHRLTIPIPGGLTLNPEHPYVLAVADPAAALASGDPHATASFRTFVIGVVTHGGNQGTRSNHTPLWELVMARSLRREGYDAVIPFNWVSSSNHPGQAAKQGMRLARKIREVAREFPASDPVDLHLIGHSEGAVVNMVALEHLATRTPPQIQAGYVEDTLLDPHAANNRFSGAQYGVEQGPLGWLARALIRNFQAQAKDPLVKIPPIVDDAQVFYQRNPASRAHGVNGDIYNLWGEVPVRGPAHYFNLTADGVTHSGKTGIVWWYERNVVPLLGDGAPQVQARVLTGAPSPAVPASGRRARSGWVTKTHRPTYSGTGLPGSWVDLFAGPADRPSELAEVGRTRIGTDGRWTLRTRTLASGRYRFLAVAVPPRHPAGPRLMMFPTAPLGLLTVAARRTFDNAVPGR